MPITVAMIEEKEFKTKVRGYDPVEVYEFLDDICDEMIVMQEEISNLQARLAQASRTQMYAQPAPQPQRDANAEASDSAQRPSQCDKQKTHFPHPPHAIMNCSLKKQSCLPIPHPENQF